MGNIPLSVVSLNRYDGKLYEAKQHLVPFPYNKRAAPGKVCQYYYALPPSYKLPRQPDSMFWEVSAKFLPYTDGSIVQSVGAYEDRGAGRLPIPVSHLVQGLVYVMHVKSVKDKVDIIRGTKTSSIPHVSVHPNGDLVSYIGCGNFNVISLCTMRTWTKDKSVHHNSILHTAFSNNGIYMAVVARDSIRVELSVKLFDGLFIHQGQVYCHELCPGFKPNRNYFERYECKFSPDSLYIAMSSSSGKLFIATRSRLALHCAIFPGIFESNDELLAHYKAHDFDPRYTHRMIAVGSSEKNIHICDIDNGSIVNTFPVNLDLDIPEREWQISVVKYTPHGILAVATTEVIVIMYDPDEGIPLYNVDLALQDSLISMKRKNDTFPMILELSFSSTADNMVVSASDGYIRIVQLHPDLDLRSLCRQAIHRSCLNKDLKHLPLPPSLILYLLQWPYLL